MKGKSYRDQSGNDEQVAKNFFSERANSGNKIKKEPQFIAK
jgi:hypothetical protein